MKRKLFLVVVAALVLGGLLVPSIGFASESSISDDVRLAQEAGQAWLDLSEISPVNPSEWIGAYLTEPQICYDLNGKPNAYMFAIESKGIVGHIIVGSSDYGYSIFEAGEAPPPSIPDSAELTGILERDLGQGVKNISEPNKLLYLGFDHLYAVYDVGKKIGVNLIFKYAFPVSGLKMQMPTPEAYIANKKAAEKALQSESLKRGGSSLDMAYFYQSGSCACGPASGVSIGRYYKEEEGYSDLPSDSAMYDDLYDYMGTSGSATWPGSYGPGFVEMTEESDGEYDNFSYSNDWIVTGGDYSSRCSDINSGHPIALMATQFYDDISGDEDFPPTGGHYVAIRGYQYPYGNTDHAIVVTDSYTSQSSLWLDWDNLGLGLFTCTIED